MRQGSVEFEECRDVARVERGDELLGQGGDLGPGQSGSFDCLGKKRAECLSG